MWTRVSETEEDNSGIQWDGSKIFEKQLRNRSSCSHMHKNVFVGTLSPSSGLFCICFVAIRTVLLPSYCHPYYPTSLIFQLPCKICAQLILSPFCTPSQPTIIFSKYSYISPPVFSFMFIALTTPPPSTKSPLQLTTILLASQLMILSPTLQQSHYGQMITTTIGFRNITSWNRQFCSLLKDESPLAPTAFP